MNDETSSKHTGGCQCGAVRFELEGDPRFVSNCHCLSCRKATSAAFSTWVGFKNEQVTWNAATPGFYASSPDVKRGFCPRCGTPLTYSGKDWDGETHFLIGAFDHPTSFVPRIEVFTEDALPWALGRKDSE